MSRILDSQIARYLDGDLGVYRPAIGPGWHRTHTQSVDAKRLVTLADGSLTSSVGCVVSSGLYG